MTNVLVTYASKHHATAGIANAIAQRLEEHDFTVTSTPVETVDDPSMYDAVVLGSAIYAGEWMPQARDFLHNHVDFLSQRPVWLFSSGPTGNGNALEMVRGVTCTDDLKPVITRIQPKDITVFRGKLDISTLGIGERLMVRMLKAPTGDYRDWNLIASWADSIAEVLKAQSVHS